MSWAARPGGGSGNQTRTRPLPSSSCNPTWNEGEPNPVIRNPLKALLLAAVFSAGALALWLGMELNRAPGAESPPFIVIQKGESPTAVSRTLAGAGILP